MHPSSQEEEDEWRAWIWRQVTPSSQPHSHHTFARTDLFMGPVLGLASYAAMPMVRYISGHATKEVTSYLLRQSIGQITGSTWGSTASASLMNSMLSIPHHVLPSLTTPANLFHPAHQATPAQHMQAFQHLQTNGLKNAKAWALALSSMVTLYLEYNGAQRMAAELPRIRTLVDNATDKSHPVSALPLVDQTKQMLLQSYSSAPCYHNTELSGFFTTPEAPNPIRMAFNVLVSLNTGFFTLLGKQSVDPVAEVYHWGAIWFYWEVLTRLIQMHGLSPVHIAYKQLHSQLVQHELTSPAAVAIPQPPARPSMSSYLHALVQRVASAKKKQH
jgi:hypothetical protein